MGVQVEWSGRRIRDSFLDDPLRGLDWLTQARRGHDALYSESPGTRNGTESNSFQLGITAFTPKKGGVDDCGFEGCILAKTEPIFNDRPYASLLYAKVRRTSAHKKNALTSDLTLGVLGLGIAEATQKFIHEHISNDVEPGGWDFQISDGGEPTGRYHVSYQRLVGEGYWEGDDAPSNRDQSSRQDAGPEDDRWFDAKLATDVNVGFYTNASVGARARLGFVDSPFWSADRLPIDSVFVPARPAAGPGEQRGKLSELYLFASGGVTGWAYNALLQGQFRDSTVELSFEPGPEDAATLKRVVWDAQGGITARFRGFSVTYAINWHSALFGGEFERSHWWGGLYLGFGAGQTQ